MSQPKEIYIFLGAPGAGKGTLAQACVEHFGWHQLSTGNLCRSHIARQTEIGKEIDFAIKSGKLVSDDLVTKMVEDCFLSEKRSSQTVILDGYPRTVAQAIDLRNMIKSKFPGTHLRLVQLQVPDSVVVRRLTDRYTCQNERCQKVYSLAESAGNLSPDQSMICSKCGFALVRRKDDQEDSVKERLRIFHQHANALLDFFHKSGEVVITIDADAPFEVVFKKFIKMCSLEPYDND